MNAPRTRDEAHRENNRAGNRARYAARMAAGLCAKCGGSRAPGDDRFCARHREDQREANRVHYQVHNAGQNTGRVARRREWELEQAAAEPAELVTCEYCCDLPWRRPRNRPCDCGGEHSPEQAGGREIATAASRAERWLSW